MNVAWNYRTAPEAEAALAPDAALPQAARFAAGERPVRAAAAALGLRVAGDDEGLLGVRYNPRRQFEVVQRAGDRRTGSAVRVLCVPPDELEEELARMRAASQHAERVVLVESWSAIATTALDDPALPGLRLLAERCPEAELVSYLPDRRAVLRIGGDYAKVSAAEDHPARDEVLRRLWEAPGRTFAMPAPRGVDPTLGIRWDAAVPGEPLAARLSSSGPEAIVDAAARVLVDLHRVTPWAGLPTNGAEALLRRGERKVLRRLGATFPALLPEAQAVAAVLRERLPGLPLGAPVVVHGDFHAANALMLRDDVALLDLDSVALGDPELDLSVFGGRLILLALAAGEPVAPVVDAVAGLPAAYAAAGGRTIAPEAFAWYLAAALLGRHVKACLRSLPPGAAGMSAAMLAIAGDALS